MIKIEFKEAQSVFQDDMPHHSMFEFALFSEVCPNPFYTKITFSKHEGDFTHVETQNIKSIRIANATEV